MKAHQTWDVRLQSRQVMSRVDTLQLQDWVASGGIRRMATKPLPLYGWVEAWHSGRLRACDEGLLVFSELVLRVGDST